MSLYSNYLIEIAERAKSGLNPKPIDGAGLAKEIIAQVKDKAHPYREESLNFLIYNTLPGTTSAAGEKAEFLKEVILGQVDVPEISRAFAFELLMHMKGGPSVRVLLDLALGDDADIAVEAGEVLKTQVFLYEADTSRLRLLTTRVMPLLKMSWKATRMRIFISCQSLMRKFKLSPTLLLKVISQPICCHWATRLTTL